MGTTTGPHVLMFIVTAVLLTGALLPASGPPGTQGVLVDTLGDGSSEQTITFPAQGGTDTSLNLSLPEGCTVNSASLDVEGIGVASGGAVTNYTFSLMNTTGRTWWEGNTTVKTSAPPALQSALVPSINLPLIASMDTWGYNTTTAAANSYPYQLFRVNVTETGISQIRVGWSGLGHYTGMSIAHYQAYVQMWNSQSSGWDQVGFGSADIYPGKWLIINSFKSNPGNYVDAQGQLYVFVHGPQNLDASARVWTDHIFVEVTGTGAQFPTGVGLDIGDDGDGEWSEPGSVMGARTLDDSGMKTELQALVDADTSGDGWVDIPLSFSSDTAGKLRVFNVSIDYDPAPPPPEPPVLLMDIPNGTYSFDEDSGPVQGLVDLAPFFHDPDSGDLRYSVVPEYNYTHLTAFVNQTGDVLDFTSGADWYGTGLIRVKASDEGGRWALSNPFEVTVEPKNDAPNIVRVDIHDTSALEEFKLTPNLEEDLWINLSVVVEDIDGDVPELEQNLSWDDPALVEVAGYAGPWTGGENMHEYTLSVLATQEQVGDVYAALTARDANATGPEMADTLNVTFTVDDTADPPVLDPVPDMKVKQDEVLDHTFTASDPDDPAGAGLVFGTNVTDNLGSDDLSFVSLERKTGEFGASPRNEDVGTYKVQASVTDGLTVRYDTFTLTVENVNDPPEAVIAFPENGSRHETGVNITFDAGGTFDPDMIHPLLGEELAYEWSSDISGRLGEGKVFRTRILEDGIHNVTLTVTDRDGASARAVVGLILLMPVSDDEDGNETDGGDGEDGEDGEEGEDGGEGEGGGGGGGDGRAGVTDDNGSVVPIIIAVVMAVAVAAVVMLMVVLRKRPPAEPPEEDGETPKQGTAESGSVTTSKETGAETAPEPPVVGPKMRGRDA